MIKTSDLPEPFYVHGSVVKLRSEDGLGRRPVKEKFTQTEHYPHYKTVQTKDPGMNAERLGLILNHSEDHLINPHAPTAQAIINDEVHLSPFLVTGTDHYLHHDSSLLQSPFIVKTSYNHNNDDKNHNKPGIINLEDDFMELHFHSLSKLNNESNMKDMLSKLPENVMHDFGNDYTTPRSHLYNTFHFSPSKIINHNLNPRLQQTMKTYQTIPQDKFEEEENDDERGSKLNLINLLALSAAIEEEENPPLSPVNYYIRNYLADMQPVHPNDPYQTNF